MLCAKFQNDSLFAKVIMDKWGFATFDFNSLCPGDESICNQLESAKQDIIKELNPWKQT